MSGRDSQPTDFSSNPETPPLRMEGYYYGFGSTGVPEIDKILSAVACAGKAYHHTESWTDDCEPYTGHSGGTPVDWIYNAAKEAADAWRARATAETPADPLDYRLPCQVRLPPSTIIGDGCTLRTLVYALQRREGLGAEYTKFSDPAALHIEQMLQSSEKAGTPLRAVPDDPIAKALAELVRLKDIKTRWESYPAGVIRPESMADYAAAEDAYFKDYKKNVDQAWIDARSALKTGCVGDRETPMATSTTDLGGKP